MPKRIYPNAHMDPDLQQLIDDFQDWIDDYDVAGESPDDTLMNAFIAGAVLAAHDPATANAAMRVKAEGEGVLPPKTRVSNSEYR
jgi:hypothetical protein